MPGRAVDFWRSKTVWLGLSGVIAGLTTAVTAYLETGDWKSAAIAAGFAWHYGLQIAQRDTIAKGQEGIRQGTEVVAATNIQAAEEIKKQITRLQRIGSPPSPWGETEDWGESGAGWGTTEEDAGGFDFGGAFGGEAEAAPFGGQGLLAEPAAPVAEPANRTRVLHWGDRGPGEDER